MRRALALAAALAAVAAQAATIRWVAQDVPPHFSFVQGRSPRSIAELGHGEVDGFMRLLLARDRAFGPQIDALLAQQVVPRLAVGAQLSSQLLDMLRAGRMDYTLEYPSVVKDYLQRVGDPGALVALPMAEGLSTPLATVSCSRTPEGRRHIEAIDAAVRELAREPNREAWMRSWRGNRADGQDMKRLNAYMDARARGGPRIE